MSTIALWMFQFLWIRAIWIISEEAQWSSKCSLIDINRNNLISRRHGHILLCYNIIHSIRASIYQETWTWQAQLELSSAQLHCIKRVILGNYWPETSPQQLQYTIHTGESHVVTSNFEKKSLFRDDWIYMHRSGYALVLHGISVTYLI